MSRSSVIIAATLFVAGLATGRLVPAPAPASAARDALPAASVAAPAADLDSDELRNIRIFQRASASVVNVTSVALRRDFFFFDVMQIPQGSGTGFFWDEEGHVVTNYHVIRGGNRFTITLADRSDVAATLVGAAPEKDLAVLRVESPNGKPLPLELGRSDSLRVGQKVLALGNPFGFDQTLTVGVVSALGRELRSPADRIIRDVIQTDAAINPGNSGGPLLDSNGRLVGVNTAIYSPSGAWSGIGFAVPVDTVRRLVPQLIQHGRPIEPGLEGVQWLSRSLAARFGLEDAGAVIRAVDPRSAAARLGLEGIGVDRFGRYVLGDVVVEIDGVPVSTADDLRDRFESLGLGARVRLTIQRDGSRREIEAELVRVG